MGKTTTQKANEIQSKDTTSIRLFTTSFHIFPTSSKETMLRFSFARVILDNVYKIHICLRDMVKRTLNERVQHVAEIFVALALGLAFSKLELNFFNMGSLGELISTSLIILIFFALMMLIVGIIEKLTSK